MLAPKAFELEPAFAGSRLVARRGPQREEYRLWLKWLPPVRQGARFPPFRSSTGGQGRTLLRLRIFVPCWKRKITFPFRK
jgi:hypothetical protein